MLNGEKGGDIKTPVMRFGTPIYDWRELQRWGISENRLPAGSEIRFRQLSLWEQYRWQIALVAIVILLQTTLIGGLLYERRRRRGAETSARNSLAELAHVNRLATAGELSASMAHEINQPLTGMVATPTRACCGFQLRSPISTKCAPRSRTSSRPATTRPKWSRASGASSRRALRRIPCST
jgi:signal transduction histidine kinase